MVTGIRAVSLSSAGPWGERVPCLDLSGGSVGTYSYKDPFSLTTHDGTFSRHSLLTPLHSVGGVGTGDPLLYFAKAKRSSIKHLNKNK